MWVSQKELKEIKAEAHSKGVALGYKHGWMMAMIDANNHLIQFGIHLHWEPESVVNQQLEKILNEKWGKSK